MVSKNTVVTSLMHQSVTLPSLMHQSVTLLPFLPYSYLLAQNGASGLGPGRGHAKVACRLHDDVARPLALAQPTLQATCEKQGPRGKER